MIATLLRKCNDFKGKQRLSRLMLSSKINFKKNIKIDGKFDCQYIIPNLKEVIGFELFINGIFEEDFIHLILSKIPNHGTFIDLGANIGSIVVPICKSRPDINAIAIEASSQMVHYLKKNIDINGILNCKIEQKAIWNISDQELSFYTPEEQYGKGMLAIDKRYNQQELVTTITLDELRHKHKLTKVDFIKVDIEGFEYFAFNGGAELLKLQDAPDLLFEFIATSEKGVSGLEPGDAQAKLLSFGYQLYEFKNRKMNPLLKPKTSGFAMIYATKKAL